MAEFILKELYKGKVQIKFFPVSHQYWVSIDGSPFKRGKGATTYIGIKDKSTPLGKWQQQVTADYLIKQIEKGIKIDVEQALEAVIQCDVQKDESADIGKDIHEWCEKYIRYKLKQPGFKKAPAKLDFAEGKQGIKSFLAWEEEHKVKFISTEEIVYSKKYGYMGIEDLVFEVDGLLCDGDFKTSNGLYNGVRAQTAAYSKARMEDGGKKTQGRWAIRFSKYNRAEHIRREQRKAEIYRMIAKVKGWDYKEKPIKAYEVFEAKFLDDQKINLERDFQAFLNMMALHKWDQETDPYLQGINW